MGCICVVNALEKRCFQIEIYDLASRYESKIPLAWQDSLQSLIDLTEEETTAAG